VISPEQTIINVFSEKYPLLKLLSDANVFMLKSAPLQIVDSNGGLIESKECYFTVEERCDDYHNAEFSYEEFMMLIEEMRAFALEHKERKSLEWY